MQRISVEVLGDTVIDRALTRTGENAMNLSRSW